MNIELYGVRVLNGLGEHLLGLVRFSAVMGPFIWGLDAAGPRGKRLGDRFSLE